MTEVNRCRSPSPIYSVRPVFLFLLDLPMSIVFDTVG
ncbi:YceK/YidQ family lipoprotein [Haloquadratum walsbyi]